MDDPRVVLMGLVVPALVGTTLLFLPRRWLWAAPALALVCFLGMRLSVWDAFWPIIDAADRLVVVVPVLLALGVAVDRLPARLRGPAVLVLALAAAGVLLQPKLQIAQDFGWTAGRFALFVLLGGGLMGVAAQVVGSAVARAGEDDRCARGTAAILLAGSALAVAALLTFTRSASLGSGVLPLAGVGLALVISTFAQRRAALTPGLASSFALALGSALLVGVAWVQTPSWAALILLAIPMLARAQFHLPARPAWRCVWLTLVGAALAAAVVGYFGREYLVPPPADDPASLYGY